MSGPSFWPVDCTDSRAHWGGRPNGQLPAGWDGVQMASSLQGGTASKRPAPCGVGRASKRPASCGVGRLETATGRPAHRLFRLTANSQAHSSHMSIHRLTRLTAGSQTHLSNRPAHRLTGLFSPLTGLSETGRVVVKNPHLISELLVDYR